MGRLLLFNMNIIQQKAKRFIKATSNLEQIVEQICRKLEHVIIDMNTSQLRDKGIDSDSVALPLPYAPMTIAYKLAEGQPINKITLYDGGDFQDKFYVKYTSQQFSLWSTDGKTEKLVKEWGKNIFGLTDNNLSLLIQKDIKPMLLTEIRKRL